MRRASARFGRRLYGHLFKSYNEKLWGRPASEISADFAAQRIKNLTVWSAFVNAIKPKRLKARGDKSKQITSLIDEFQYPKYGPGMMWEACRDKVEAFKRAVAGVESVRPSTLPLPPSSRPSLTDPSLSLRRRQSFFQTMKSS